MAPKHDSASTNQLITEMRNEIHNRFNSLESSLVAKIEEQSKQLSNLKQLISKQENTINCLKDENAKIKEVMIIQAKQLDEHETKKRECYAIFHNIPEDEVPLKDHVYNIASKINSEDLFDRDFTPFRIGKQSSTNSNRNRPTKVKFSSANNKSSFLRKFNNTTDKNNIFITYDLSPLAQKENQRLRQRRKEVADNPANISKKVYIKQGKLYIDNNIIETFDIKNQVFRK